MRDIMAFLSGGDCMMAWYSRVIDVLENVAGSYCLKEQFYSGMLTVL